MQERIKNYLTDIKRLVDQKLEEILKNNNPLVDALYKSASYSVSGGKRVRAVFAVLVSRLFDVSREKMIDPACAIELVHAASLIMDDLPYMDDSQLRRGKPANHVVFGQDVALLASIGIISEALQLILSNNTLSAEERLQMASVLDRAFGFNGLPAGQFVDLKLKRKDIDFEIIEFINQKKTAALFQAAGQIAALAGHASDRQMEAITSYSQDIGFAFQIVDDLLDLNEHDRTVGHSSKEEKMNFVNLVGKEKARKYLNEYRRKAEDALKIFGSKADELKAFTEYLMQRVQ